MFKRRIDVNLWDVLKQNKIRWWLLIILLWLMSIVFMVVIVLLEWGVFLIYKILKLGRIFYDSESTEINK